MKNLAVLSAILGLIILGSCGKSGSKAGGPDTLPPIANPGHPDVVPAQVAKMQLPKMTPGKHGDTTVTESGLMYIDTKVGKGASPKAGQEISVNYTGMTTDGHVFDSNTDPSKGHLKPLDFTIGAGRVIKAWEEGFLSMKTGGKRRLIVPSELGYGANGNGPDIPPDAMLIFDVELLSVK
ncbi:MAG: FKBP-type peptidyl-prolyl cis-trans isomerase [bacterium]